MPLVFLTPYKKTYSSDFCSLSTLIGFIFLLLAIFIPFFAAFSSEDFWLRIKEYLEQPKVEYSNDYMIYITKAGENKIAKTFFYSSNNDLNNNYKKLCDIQPNKDNICPSKEQLEEQIKVTNIPFDNDNDGINDKITVTLETSNKGIITSSDGETTDIKLIFFLKYILTKEVKLLMTPMIYLNIPIIGSNQKEIILNGDLELVQKSPLVSTTITSQIYNYENVFELDENLYSPFDLLHYYNKYKNLNYTLKYNYEKVEENSSGSLKINIEMNIPKLQRIFYIQSVYEAIKYAWMQYFYIFLPIYIILYIIYKFIIGSNIFYSHVKSDL